MTGSDTIYGEKERAEVQRQLERLLGNPHFSNSRRFPSFLRFIVQEELDGRGDQLKERTLGIEVFGRDAGYDTTSDPIVRVTAAEIRKRIAQYYQDSSNPDELRISLPPGSYVPHFEWPKAQPLPSVTSPPESLDADLHTLPISQPAALLSDPQSPPRRIHISWLVTACLLIVILAAGGWSLIRSRPTSLDRFWAPVLDSGDPVVVCFPQSSIEGITLRDAADPLQQKHLEEKMDGVIVDDLQPLVSISGLLEMRHQRYNLIGENAATLT